MISRAMTFASAVLVAALLVFTDAAAASADDGISLSRDGRTWSQSLPAPLFDDQVRWVPGDSRVAQVLVRNDSGASARMRIDLISGAVDDLLRIGDLEVATRIDGGRWTSTSVSGIAELSTAGIAAGGIRTVEVRVVLPWSSPNLTQNLQLDFDLRVTLTGEDPDSPSILSATGGGIDLGLLLTAGATLGGGTALLRTRRRTLRPFEEAPHD